jgi:hypothetical protein
MSNNLNQADGSGGSSPKQPKNDKVKFLWLLIIPIPIGLLMNVSNVLTGGSQTNNDVKFVLFSILTVIICSVAGIGLCGGFKKGNWEMQIAGLLLGLCLSTIEIFLAVFIGCCSELSHI